PGEHARLLGGRRPDPQGRGAERDPDRGKAVQDRGVTAPLSGSPDAVYGRPGPERSGPFFMPGIPDPGSFSIPSRIPGIAPVPAAPGIHGNPGVFSGSSRAAIPIGQPLPRNSVNRKFPPVDVHNQDSGYPLFNVDIC